MWNIEVLDGEEKWASQTDAHRNNRGLSTHDIITSINEGDFASDATSEIAA